MQEQAVTQAAGESELLHAAGSALSREECALACELAHFVSLRLGAAAQARRRTGEATASEDLQMAVHAFLRECWDALDGLGRLVNVCLAEALPAAGLHPPGRMTRQCTFYTVRRALHTDPAGAEHPVAVLLWHETRADPHPAYARLSFLYNLALFVPLPLPEGRRLPGGADTPPHLLSLTKPPDMPGAPLDEGMGEMLDWLRGFIGRCYALMARTMEGEG